MKKLSNLTCLRAASVVPADADIEITLRRRGMLYFKQTPTRSYIATKNYWDEVDVYAYYRDTSKIDPRPECSYDQLFVYNPLKDALT